jgi:hypothetical protein
LCVIDLLCIFANLYVHSSIQFFKENFFCFINILIVILDQVAAYDTKQQKMDFFDPSRKDDFLFISGTKVTTISIVGALNNFCKPKS